MHIKISIFLFVSLCSILPAEESKASAPTIESQSSEIAKLKEQLVAMERQYQFEMALCRGALDGARSVALASPTKSTPQIKPEAKEKAPVK